MKVHLGVCGLILHTLSHSRVCECDSKVALLAYTFPSLCFVCKAKPKVMTTFLGANRSLVEFFSIAILPFFLLCHDFLLLGSSPCVVDFAKYKFAKLLLAPREVQWVFFFNHSFSYRQASLNAKLLLVTREAW